MYQGDLRDTERAIAETPDSEPHDVYFVGRTPIKSRGIRVDERACHIATTFLLKNGKRAKYAGGIARNLEMVVKCREGVICWTPRDGSPGRGTTVPLIQVTSVSDMGKVSLFPVACILVLCLY